MCKIQPFGGKHIILFGDPAQLPTRYHDHIYCKDIFRHFNIFVLQEIVRQDNKEFAQMLREVRLGHRTKEVVAYFKQRMVNDYDINEIIMGAIVILRRNLNTAAGHVNGRVAKVKVMGERYVIITTLDEPIEDIPITPIRQYLEYCGQEDRFIREQLPLELGWAVTIHRVQGQAYTALSRPRKLENLRLLAFEPRKIKLHKYYKKLLEWVEKVNLLNPNREEYFPPPDKELKDQKRLKDYKDKKPKDNKTLYPIFDKPIKPNDSKQPFVSLSHNTTHKILYGQLFHTITPSLPTQDIVTQLDPIIKSVTYHTVTDTSAAGTQPRTNGRDVWAGLSSPLQSAPGYQRTNSGRDVWVGLSSPLQSAPGYQSANSVRDVWVGLSSPLQSAPGYQRANSVRDVWVG
ncbi:unnamed protein product, partial [Medioppia subpectinata]